MAPEEIPLQGWAAHKSDSTIETTDSDTSDTSTCRPLFSSRPRRESTDVARCYILASIPPQRKACGIPHKGRGSIDTSLSSSSSSSSSCSIRRRRPRTSLQPRQSEKKHRSSLVKQTEYFEISSDDSAKSAKLPIPKKKQPEPPPPPVRPATTTAAPQFWGGAPKNDQFGRSRVPTLSKVLDLDNPSKGFQSVIESLEKKDQSGPSQAARIASFLFLRPLSSLFLHSLLPVDSINEGFFWSELHSEKFLTAEEMISLALRGRRWGEKGDRVADLPLIRSRLRELRRLTDADERSVDVKEISVAQLAVLAALEGVEETLVLAEALRSMNEGVGEGWEKCFVQIEVLLPPERSPCRGAHAQIVHTSIEVTAESVFYFRPGAPCSLAGVPAVIHSLHENDLPSSKQPPFRPRVTFLVPVEMSAFFADRIGKEVEVTWQVRWEHMSLCGAIAKTHLLNTLTALCIDTPYAARAAIFPDAAELVCANLPINIMWSLLPLRLSRKGASKTSERSEFYRDLTQQIWAGVQGQSIASNSRHHPTFFGAETPPRRITFKKLSKETHSYPPQQRNHIIGRFVSSTNKEQTEALGKVLRACELCEEGRKETPKSSRVAFVVTSEPATLGILSTTALYLLSDGGKRAVIHCGSMRDYFEVIAQAYGFCENAFGDPILELAPSNNKYALWLRKVSFGSFALTGTRPAWNQEWRAQWRRDNIEGPDAELLPTLARWWSKRLFADTLHVRFRRKVCEASVKLTLQLMNRPTLPARMIPALPLWGSEKLTIRDEETRIAAVCWFLFLLRRFGPHWSSTTLSQPPAEDELTKLQEAFKELQRSDLDPSHEDFHPGLIDQLKPVLVLIDQYAHLIDNVILANARVTITGPTTTKEEVIDLPHTPAGVVIAVSSSTRGFSKGDILNITAHHLTAERLVLISQRPDTDQGDFVPAAYEDAELEAMRTLGSIQYHAFKQHLGLSWPRVLENLTS